MITHIAGAARVGFVVGKAPYSVAAQIGVIDGCSVHIVKKSCTKELVARDAIAVAVDSRAARGLPE